MPVDGEVTVVGGTALPVYVCPECVMHGSFTGDARVASDVTAHVRALAQMGATKAVPTLDLMLRATFASKSHADNQPSRTVIHPVYRNEDREQIYRALLELPCEQTTKCLVALLAKPATP